MTECTQLDRGAVLSALVTAVHVLACCGLVVSAVCRITHTDERTHWVVRWAFVALGGAGLIGAGAVLLGQPPTLPAALLALATLAVQVVAARLWVRGVPAGYLERHSEL